MSAPPAGPVVGVLLAAGAGRRLGRGPKALLSLDGEPQVTRTVDVLRRGGCDHVVVVAGAASDRVRQALQDRPCRIVVNEDWHTGMGSSFRHGVEAAGRILAGRRDGLVVVALVDQPDIGPPVVGRLLESASGHRVTAAGVPGPRGRVIRGHPVVFPLHLARRAAAMAVGDAAGRAWLRAHPEAVDLVDMAGLATGRDVDTPADLDGWLRSRAGLTDLPTGAGSGGAGHGRA